ncbi:hypothetical protein AgCh_001798 [Apium graveolens]
MKWVTRTVAYELALPPNLQQGQKCQAIQSLIETSQGRGVDLGIREPPARKTTSMDQTRTAVLRRVRNAREFRRLFVRQPRQVFTEGPHLEEVQAKAQKDGFLLMLIMRYWIMSRFLHQG